MYCFSWNFGPQRTVTFFGNFAWITPWMLHTDISVFQLKTGTIYFPVVVSCYSRFTYPCSERFHLFSEAQILGQILVWKLFHKVTTFMRSWIRCLNFIYWFETERERNLGLLFHLPMYTLFDSCMCPEWDWTCKLGIYGWCCNWGGWWGPGIIGVV